ncbi:YbaY family lipoprotein [Tropicimonas marinistellae]|uniref:YbaY family lipoprotein n=1 Tax=Tropicimonas marinistellae TaxID=1739787 RepID=UPI00083181EE|nr:YbaY family lipoprotein [Tropicimonas marinistellae]
MYRFSLAVALLANMPALAPAETLSGTVTYRERMMLPPDAVLEVRLEDVSLADAPSVTLGTYRADAPKAPPFPFEVEYDPAEIDVSGRYSLRATVRAGDKLLMTTDTAYPVLTAGDGTDVEMLLRMTGSDATAKPDSDFVNTYWKILTLGGEAVQIAEGAREPHVILRTDGSYNATVGCNMIRGAHETQDDTVRFKPGVTTLMACPPPLDSMEKALIATLAAAEAYSVSGEMMQLTDSSGEEIATFRAVYF